MQRPWISKPQRVADTMILYISYFQLSHLSSGQSRELPVFPIQGYGKYWNSSSAIVKIQPDLRRTQSCFLAWFYALFVNFRLFVKSQWTLQMAFWDIGVFVNNWWKWDPKPRKDHCERRELSHRMLCAGGHGSRVVTSVAFPLILRLRVRIPAVGAFGKLHPLH